MAQRDRTYQRSHPWITFRLDLSRVGHEFWILLGQARALCEQLSGMPLRPSMAARLHQLFLGRGALATTAIEGNTLSEEEVQQLLRGELQLPPSRAYLADEVQNIVDACNTIGRDLVAGADPDLSCSVIKNFNGMILRGLPEEEGTVPGELRRHSVGVARYRGAPAEDCEYLLDRLCAWLNGREWADALPGRPIEAAILRAVVAHLYLAWIHPFGNGNGRTARLIEFSILVAACVPTVAAHLLSNHYNLTRTEYYRQLDLASRSGGDIVPFLTYALRGFVDGLREQADFIRREQTDIAWRNYVYDHFRKTTLLGAADQRRRQLVLDLSTRDSASRTEIPTLTAELARAYAGKTAKTLTRDLNELVQADLVEELSFEEPRSGARGGSRRYRARSEKILAFVPPQRSGDPRKHEPLR